MTTPIRERVCAICGQDLKKLLKENRYIAQKHKNALKRSVKQRATIRELRELVNAVDAARTAQRNQLKLLQKLVVTALFSKSRNTKARTAYESIKKICEPEIRRRAQ